jgi:hypothetical protein
MKESGVSIVNYIHKLVLCYTAGSGPRPTVSNDLQVWTSGDSRDRRDAHAWSCALICTGLAPLQWNLKWAHPTTLRNRILSAGLEVLTAVLNETSLFWDIASCSPKEITNLSVEHIMTWIFESDRQLISYATYINRAPSRGNACLDTVATDTRYRSLRSGICC